MAALSADTASKTRNDSAATYRTFVMTASKTIYQGSIVMITAADQLALTGADTASCRCVGIATHGAVSASSGTTYITVKYGHDELIAAASTMVGQVDVAVCISTDNDCEVIGTTTNDVKVGIVTQAVSTTAAWIGVCCATPL